MYILRAIQTETKERRILLGDTMKASLSCSANSNKLRIANTNRQTLDIEGTRDEVIEAFEKIQAAIPKTQLVDVSLDSDNETPEPSPPDDADDAEAGDTDTA